MSNSTMTVPDGPFSDLHKAGPLLSLCVLMDDKELSRKGVVWTAMQSKTRFSISFFPGTSGSLEL